MKKLIISQKENELRLQTEQPLGFEDILNLTLSAILSMANEITSNAPTDKQQAVKEYLFDQINMAASSLLAQFAPEIDLRKDIQAEAIRTLEEQLLTERAQQVLNNKTTN